MEENIPGYPFTRTEAKRRATVMGNLVKILQRVIDEREERIAKELRRKALGGGTGEQLDLPF
jgi:hypothetical protein